MLRFAKPDPIDDAGVIEFVGDNRIFRGEQSLEQATVRIKAGAIKNGVFCAEEFAEFSFKLLMDTLGAANEPNTGHAVTPFIERFFCRSGNRRMLRQAEIIIGTEIEDGFAVRNADHGALGRDDDTLAFVSAGG